MNLPALFAVPFSSRHQFHHHGPVEVRIAYLFAADERQALSRVEKYLALHGEVMATIGEIDRLDAAGWDAYIARNFDHLNHALPDRATLVDPRHRLTIHLSPAVRYRP